MIKYNVNKEKRTVVAYFEDNYDYWFSNLYHFLSKFTAKMYFDEVIELTIVESVLKNRKLYGKASCYKEDKWDEEKGKEIAKNKLIKRWNNAKVVALLQLKDYIDKQYMTVSEKISSYL